MFSKISRKSIEKERKRHDKAIEDMEDMQRAQIEWAKKARTIKLHKKCNNERT